MAWIAGRGLLLVLAGRQARCLRENRARKRRARGSDSLVRVLRRVRMVVSSWGVGEVADGAMMVRGMFCGC